MSFSILTIALLKVKKHIIMIKIKPGDIVSPIDFPDEKYTVVGQKNTRCRGLFIPVLMTYNTIYYWKRTSLIIVN